MKHFTLIMIFLFSGSAFSQNDSLKPQVLKAGNTFKKLLDSPERQIYDSSHIAIESSFWHSRMPMSNQDATYWNVDLSPVEKSHPVEPRKCYLFIGESVYIFKYNKGFISDKSIRIPQTPKRIVVEYFDEKENKIKYVKQNGPFLTGYDE